MTGQRAGEVRRVAIITGGGTGVGAAAAEQLARRGLNVAIVYSRSAKEAEATATACRAAGAEAMTIKADVAVDEDCRRAAREAEAKWGRIDVLVNSAGKTQFAAMGDLEAHTAKNFHEVFGVNTVGAFQMARAVAPAMRKHGNGSICSVSSMGSLNGNGSSYAYVMSKAALNALTMALARNLAPEIKVNAVLPGLITTRWLKDGLGEDVYNKVRDNWADATLLQKVCTAEEIADVIVWLSLDNAQITGQLITADGGYLLGRPTRVSK